MALVFYHFANVDIVTLALLNELLLQIIYHHNQVIAELFDHDDASIVLFLLLSIVLAVICDVGVQATELLLNPVCDITD